jgi:Transglycosylase SLT domain
MLRSYVGVLFFLLFISIRPSVSTERLHSNPTWPTDREFRSVNHAVEVACAHYRNVEPSLVWALIWEESKYDPLALGRKGEVGLGQLSSATAITLGVQDRTNVTENVQASVRHLSHLLKKYKSNTQLVLSAYNSGEGAVDRCYCVPARSRAYVNRIEQSRFFAKRIVAYQHNTLVPSTIPDARVPQLEKQLAEVKAGERFLLPLLAGLLIFALTVGPTRVFRAAAIAGAILAILAVAAERFPVH